MIEYIEVVPHTAEITVYRVRYANQADQYDARNLRTTVWVSGYDSYTAALAAVTGP